jgi:hypothetical protein
MLISHIGGTFLGVHAGVSHERAECGDLHVHEELHVNADDGEAGERVSNTEIMPQCRDRSQLCGPLRARNWYQ